jgi:hypothetical protein
MSISIAYTTFKQAREGEQIYYVTQSVGYELCAWMHENFCKAMVETALDIEDFEAHLKSAATEVPSSGDAEVLCTPNIARTPDGRTTIRITAATPGTTLNLREVYFETANLASVKSVDTDGTVFTDVTYKLFDSDGDETLVPAEAVKTQVDLEPTYLVEVLGGVIDLPKELWRNATDRTGLWWAAAILAPDVPRNLGGSKPFLTFTNLELRANSEIIFDGVATKSVPYDPTYHSGKMRFIVLHPVGEVKPFQVTIRGFR